MTSWLASEPQLIASPVVLVPKRYLPVVRSATASVQVESGKATHRHPSAPGMASPSVRAIAGACRGAAAGAPSPHPARSDARRRAGARSLRGDMPAS